MRHVAILGLFAASVLVTATTANAHFLFIRIGDHAEAGRGVEVFFSERAEAGDPRFIAKIAKTKLWTQSEPGKFQPMTVRQGTDRLRAYLPSAGSGSVTGFLEYGVLTRKVPFLLRYYPKAVTGEAKALNSLKGHAALPVEITADFSEKSVTLVALKDGKPIPYAVFTTVDDDLVNTELKADKSGRAVWKLDDRGHFCVYVKVVRNQPGEKGGAKYHEIREFATLAFRWPLTRDDADAKAVAMFQNAIANRATWKAFPGFTAKVAGRVDGRDFSGSLKVAADGDVSQKLDEKTAVEWVNDQVGSIAMHRRASDDSQKTKPVLRFADEDTTHPLGRLMTFGGGHFASSYRVKDRQITVVNRNFGTQNMTIRVLQNKKNADGKFLPRSYTVQYWDAKNGTLLRTKAFLISWKRVGNFDLPTSLTVTTNSSAGFNVRSLRLSGHRLLSPNP